MNRGLKTGALCLIMLSVLGLSLSCATGENSQSAGSKEASIATAEKNSNSSIAAARTPDSAIELAEQTSQISPSNGNSIPAHYKDALSVGSLGPILSPEQFTGKVRMAYQAAREIPVTLAQLPCYCHCDRSFGHKSLHSCFEDTHGSQCSICMDEALLAYQLQKEQRLSPAEIRQTIIERYREN